MSDTHISKASILHACQIKQELTISDFEKEVKNIPGIEAVKVSEIIGKALTDKKPKVKYIIGPGAKKMDILRKFPVKMRDKMLFNAVYKS